MRSLLSNAWILFFSFSISYAQEISLDMVQPDNFSIKESGFTDSGHFYVLEHAKNEEYKTRFRVWDNNFQHLNTITRSKKVDDYEFQYVSNSGSYFIHNDMKFDSTYDWFLAGKEKDFDFDPKELEDYVIHKTFFNDEDAIYIAQKIVDKKAKLSWESLVKTENILADDVSLLTMDSKTGNLKETLVKQPEDCYFAADNTKILFNDDQKFIVSFVTGGDEGQTEYTVATYKYDGTFGEPIKLVFGVDDPNNEKFANLNLGSGSFATYMTINRFGTGNSLGNRDIDYQAVPTGLSLGNMVYDNAGKNYYAYAGVKPKKGDSGILITKFDNNGELIWSKRHVFDDTSFHYLNSFNRYLTFDAYAKFIGVSVYSTKGKNYCDFYVFNKNTGELLAQEKYKNYGFFGRSRNYNGLDTDFEIKTDDYKNLGLDRHAIFTALFDNTFKEYLVKLNAKGEHLIKSRYTPSGLNTVVSAKKDNVIKFQKFKI